MHVILDSTALIADFHLSSAACKGLLEGAKSGIIQLAVPELVILEVVNKWRSRVSQVAGAADAVRKDAGRLGLIGVQVDGPSVEDETAAYERGLREKLGTANALILALPSVPHEGLVRKAIERKAPFGDRGTGYRDALIWESVKEVLRADDQESVTFVTANKADFGSTSTGIREGLLDELSSDSISHERIAIVDSTAAAAAATLDQAQRLFVAFEEKLSSDPAFNAWFFQRLAKHVDLDLDQIGDERLPDGLLKFTSVYNLQGASYFKAFRSWLISAGKIGLEFEAEADVDVDFEYEQETPSYSYETRDRRTRLDWHSDSTTVTASLLGQLEIEETTGEVTFDRVYIWKLSEPRRDF